MPSFIPRPGGARSIHEAAIAAAATDDDVGADDVVWPLDSRSAVVFAAEKLSDLALSRRLDADDLRAIGMELIRRGRPVGWLGALLLIDACTRRP